MKYLIDRQWKFSKTESVDKLANNSFSKSGCCRGVMGEEFDDSSWRTVDLPHDFVMEADFSECLDGWNGGDDDIPQMDEIKNLHSALGSKNRSVGWYRKKLVIDDKHSGSRIFITFDGVYRDSSVYVNGFFIDRHLSGYTGFSYDITDFVRFGEENTIVVFCDARETEGWWYQGGGIYRHVYLEVKPRTHIVRNGIYAFARLSDNRKSAVVTVETTLKSYEPKALTEIKTRLTGGNAPVDLETERVSLLYGETKSIVQHIKIENPILWDIENPYLYRLTVTTSEGETESVCIGIKEQKFDKENGFLLNGRRVKIKGCCLHQDFGGLGIALPDGIMEYKIKQMKSMGCNAIRMSHNPVARELLDACDREGMLVMAETRLFSSAPEDMRQLIELVKYNRNHVSIILWGIGNEETRTQGTRIGANIAVSMNRAIKALDLRPVTMAFLFWNFQKCCAIDDVGLVSEAARETDVFGINYYTAIWEKIKEYYKMPIICTEHRSLPQTRGCYISDKEKCTVGIMDSENGLFYLMGENEWRYVNSHDYVSGYFIWTGMDYYGEPTPYTYPAVSSQFGALDLCGFEKDAYYYFKAWWSREKVLHILPHWNRIDGLNETRDVWCFTNADSVELFVNGKSMEKQSCEKDGHIVWKAVPYSKGYVSVRGFWNDNSTQERRIETTGPASRIRCETKYEFEDADFLYKLICVYAEDDKGRRVPDADSPFEIKCTNGAWTAFSNGNPACHLNPDTYEGCLFNGLAMVIVKIEKNSAGTAMIAGIEV